MRWIKTVFSWSAAVAARDSVELASPVGSVWSGLFQILEQSGPFLCDLQASWCTGRQAKLIFILAGDSFSLPSRMRMKALYLDVRGFETVQQADTRR